MLHLITNTPVKHKISILRDKRTGTKEFREIAGELAYILCYEAFRNAPCAHGSVESPMGLTASYTIDENEYVFLPILRAGLGLVDGLLSFLPNAKLGHIGLYRDEETLQHVKDYYKVPRDIERKTVFILDPMLATGGSALAAIEILKEQGVKDINMICLFAAPEGVSAIESAYPDVDIYAAALDERLNDSGYIVPGVGDAGDRLYGTK
ncbi:MAG: uracil phosphoribosyltransferase [Oscillospiraceae bacterium]|jgi:uracil phosphoribosyltransferase|nr:uracil phosphoribosyltransferase [Oscillospiraceae bacterium]